MILDYIKYLLKAKDEHSLHSPFVFDFYTQVLNDKMHYAEYDEIEICNRDVFDFYCTYEEFKQNSLLLLCIT